MKTTLAVKALRDMRTHFGAYLACAMVMAIGVTMYASMSRVVDNLPNAQYAFYEEYRFADAFANVRSIPLSKVGRLASMEGVAGVSARLTASARVVEEGSGNRQVRLISYDASETTRLNDILITRGNAPSAYEICVNENFFKANDFSVGDILELSLSGKRISFTVSGSYMSPEFIYIMPDGSIMPDDAGFGIAYISVDTLSALLGRQSEADDIAIAFHDGVTFDDLNRELESFLSPYGITRLYGREDQASHSMLEMEMESMKAMVNYVPPIFLMVGALIMTVIIKRVVEQQHEQIGLMKAFGYTRGEILGHYSVYGIFIGVLSSAAGGLLGASSAEYIAELYRTFFVMPGITGATSLGSVAALSALSLLFSVGASLFGARGVLKLGAAEAMRPPAPPSGKPILIERIGPLWNSLSCVLRMSLRNLFRARSRSVATMIGLTICYAMTAAVFAFLPATDFMLNENFLLVNRYDVKLNLLRPSGVDVLETTLSRTPGAIYAEAVLEAPVILRVGALYMETDMRVIPDKATLYRLYDDEDVPVALPQDGVAITYRLAQKLNLSIGDSVLLDLPAFDTKVTLPVTALSEQYMSNSVIVPRSILPPALRSIANGAMISCSDSEQFISRLENAGNVASVQSVRRVLEVAAEMMQASIGSLYAMALMAILSGFAIVYNAATVILSERTRELASLRILGFSLGEAVGVVAFEELPLCLGGIAFGIPLAASLMEGLALAMSEISDSMTYPPMIPLSTHAIAAASMLLAWLAAVAISARKLRRQPMADVLKGRE